MQIAYRIQHTLADWPEDVLSVQIICNFHNSPLPSWIQTVFSQDATQTLSLHMHELRNHLRRNHFIVRCKLSLRPYLGALCQGTGLVVCLLLPTNKHHVNTNAQVIDMTNTWCQDLENPLARLTEFFLKVTSTNQTYFVQILNKVLLYLKEFVSNCSTRGFFKSRVRIETQVRIEFCFLFFFTK